MVHFETEADKIGDGLDLGCERDVKTDLRFLLSVVNSGGVYWDIECWEVGEVTCGVVESSVTFHIGIRWLLDSQVEMLKR